jgi:streptogramin lyase
MPFTMQYLYKNSRRCSIILLLLLLTSLGVKPAIAINPEKIISRVYPVTPIISNPVIATFGGEFIKIAGTGFGTPDASHYLKAISGSVVTNIPSTHSIIFAWTDTCIIFKLPKITYSGRIQVITPGGSSPEVEVAVYEYDWFDIPPTAGTNGAPLSIAVDEAHRVWVNQEFHLEFQKLDPSVGIVEGIAIPQPPSPGPFASTIFADHRTQTSVLGEDVLIDPMGRVWFTQGGGSLYSGIHPNHSRVVCLIPDGPAGYEFRVYNVPGDRNEVIGLAWDHTRNWIWFAEGGLVNGGAIVGFDPELIPWDNNFAFDSSLDHQLCSSLTETGCYQRYQLEDTASHPAHLLVTDDGKIWFTAFWGRSIGRLDPVTGIVNKYPVPQTISKALPSYIVGPGPWEILEAPNGDIIFNEFFDATITRFDINMADDISALELDISGNNPAMTDRVIPFYNSRKESIHSIAYDTLGNLWYTIHTPNEPHLKGSLGYLTPDWNHMTRLPPLKKFPGTGSAMADGIAMDDTTGDIWFCEFQRKRIGRLKRLAELP